MILDLLQNLLYIDSVKELWEKIKKIFLKKTDWKLNQLNMKSIQVKRGEDNVMVHVCRLKIIWRETDHFWLVENPRSAERGYTLKQRLFTFPMGWNPIYEGVWVQILNCGKKSPT